MTAEIEAFSRNCLTNLLYKQIFLGITILILFQYAPPNILETEALLNVLLLIFMDYDWRFDAQIRCCECYLLLGIDQGAVYQQLSQVP